MVPMDSGCVTWASVSGASAGPDPSADVLLLSFLYSWKTVQIWAVTIHLDTQKTKKSLLVHSGVLSVVSELCDSEETDRADISSLLMSLRERSLLDRDSLGCLYRYMTARPMPLCFRVSWLTLGSCREEKHHWISAWNHGDPTIFHQYSPPLGSWAALPWSWVLAMICLEGDWSTLWLQTSRHCRWTIPSSPVWRRTS